MPGNICGNLGKICWTHSSLSLSYNPHPWLVLGHVASAHHATIPQAQGHSLHGTYSCSTRSYPSQPRQSSPMPLDILEPAWLMLEEVLSLVFHPVLCRVRFGRRCKVLYKTLHGGVGLVVAILGIFGHGRLIIFNVGHELLDVLSRKICMSLSISKLLDVGGIQPLLKLTSDGEAAERLVEVDGLADQRVTSIGYHCLAAGQVLDEPVLTEFLQVDIPMLLFTVEAVHQEMCVSHLL
mmetsp:Transcript_137330/g.238860  ORF Transcript_137330/g.238860 Transcript_137330/m.238860 type:complete len:237 (+) Transcript_137330:628-1338(+)